MHKASCWSNTHRLVTRMPRRKHCCVLHSEDTILINESVKEISEVLDSLDTVKCFAEVYGDKWMIIMLNESIGKKET